MLLVEAITPTSIINNVNGLGAVPKNQDVSYFGFAVQMKPSVFGKLAAPLNERNATSAAGLAELLQQGRTIGSPFLIVDYDPESTNPIGKVQSHEGRNRMIAINKLLGDVPVEVHIFLGLGLRRRHITDKDIANMRNLLIAENQTTPTKGPFW
jgi:hypothetical protein